MHGESNPRYETVQRVANYLQRQQQATGGAING
jgi:hypothetical protein